LVLANNALEGIMRIHRFRKNTYRINDYVIVATNVITALRIYLDKKGK
jgi:hypothetical protein